jgi:ESAT-6 family protein
VGCITGNFEDFAAAEASFHAVLDALEQTLSTLDRDLQASLFQWHGDAADAYRAAHDRWRRAADDMAVRLAGLRTVIATSHANFGAAVRANLRMWGAG